MNNDMTNMTMPELVAKYNKIAEEMGTPTVGPKSFNSRKTAVDRINKLLARAGAEAPTEPTSEPVPTKAKTKDSKVLFRTVREMAEHYLLQPISYKTLLRLVKAYFPEAATSVKCLRWYATQMRERGESVPTRPRSPSTEELARFPE